MANLRIGSRGSQLALWQANHVAGLLREQGHTVSIDVIKTTGDKILDVALAKVGTKGMFTKEIEEALAAGRIDLAVHSMKDVPTAIPSGLAFPAVCRREDVRDCLVSASGAKLAELPAGARVGTSSLRRQSQLRHYRPDLDLRQLRGNVDTRLRKLEQGEYDVIALAKAGLDRLGWSARVTEVLSTDVSLPAVGQGALGIEARAGDAEVLAVLERLDHAETRAAVMAERALLAELEGGCQVPMGAWARMEHGELVLEACVLSMDDAERIRKRAVGALEQPEALGRELARSLLAAGADRILRLAGRNVDNH